MSARIKKTIIWTMTGLVAVIITASVYVYVNMNSIAARAIERVGTHTLQAAVTVDNVAIDIGNRQFTINGVTIANPKGFTGNRAIYLDRVAVKADKVSMARLDLAYIDIESPEVSLEINNSGTNLGKLKANAGSGKENAQAQSSQQNASTIKGPSVLIKRFVLKKPELFVDVPQLAQKTGPMRMDTITIRDIGRKDSPAPLHQATAQIFNAVLKVAIKKAAQEGHLSDLKGEVLDQLGTQADIKRSFLKGLNSSVEDVGTSIRDAIGP